MRIIELNEIQFNNYSKLHSSRNYMQTIEYANTKKDYKSIYLGLLNENDNTLVAATLILEKQVSSFKIGYVPGGFLIDYDNDTLFKDFINSLKLYLKNKKFVYVEVDNIAPYKMFDKKGNVIYYDTNILKTLDDLHFKKTSKSGIKKVVLESEKTPSETYSMFNSNTKRNITLAAKRAITIYKDETTSISPLLKLNPNLDSEKLTNLINIFNDSASDETNEVEIYFAEIDPEQYVNNYRFLLKSEEEKNERLNYIMQDMSIKKGISFVNKKMTSDKKISKYNKELVKATNLYTNNGKSSIIGAILILKNNREIYFLDEVYNKELKEFYSSHLIKWEIIKKYLTEGYKIFNFGEVKTIDKKDGNYTFKIGFGGKVYECIGTYDLVINKLLYYIVKIITKFKK